MSRVIKFRVWDSASRKLYYEWMPDKRHFFGHEHSDGGASLDHWPRRDNVHPAKLGPSFFSRNENGVVWEQFTGLQDANGHDIYEGDILSCTREHSFPTFQDGKWVMETEHIGFMKHHLDKVRSEYLIEIPNWCSNPLYWFESARVIGNINETPDLLK